MRKDRLEMFSDGVIAIIITLMVLEIKKPATGNFSFAAILSVVEHIGVYAMSFLLLAVMWVNHHQIFLHIEKINTKITWLNLLLLFFMSLIPLPTKALGEDFNLPQSHFFYGLILTATSISYTLLNSEINKYLNHISHTNRKAINRKISFSIFLYALSIPLSFASVYLSLIVFISIPLMYFIPTKKLQLAQ